MNQSTKTTLIHGAAIVLGIGTGTATAYFSNNPQLAAAIGGVSYLGAAILGHIDPSVTPVSATVTKNDIDDLERVVEDLVTHHTQQLGSDIIPVIMDVKDIVSSLKPLTTESGNLTITTSTNTPIITPAVQFGAGVTQP